MSTTPMERELCFMSISELSEKIRTKALSPVEVAQAVLDRIERHNEEMHVYITVTKDTALEQARRAEQEILSGGYKGPLHGIPISLKDNVSTRGIRTTCASQIKQDWVPDEDATVYARLREAGAILVGKANMSELAFSGNPVYPPPLNPWHYGRTAAGSSSGSAVGLAIGMVHGSIGTDTGGSGRGPAIANGVIGFKATYGRVSRWGVFPTSYSLDSVAMMTRTVRDSAIMLQATSGNDPKDESSSMQAVPNFSEKIGRDIKGLRLGFARGFKYEDVDPDVVNALKKATDVFRSLGAEVTDVQLPYLEHCRNTYTAIANPEAATVHYDNLRRSPEKLGHTLRIRLDLGSAIPATAYIHAQRVRKLMRDGYKEIFKKVDAIIGPASPTRTGEAGGISSFLAATVVNGKEVRSREVGEGYLNTYALTGLPAMVLPCGFSSEDTPMGLQVAGKWFDEATVLQVAHAYEQATDWHNRRPPNPRD